MLPKEWMRERWRSIRSPRMKLSDSRATSSYSMDDLAAARHFYETVLGLSVRDIAGGLVVNLYGGGRVFLYLKEHHYPATYTVLTFAVPDVEAAVLKMTAGGVRFERFPGFRQDKNNISRSVNKEDGPMVAWFKDPAGNILALIDANDPRAI
jgi:catechol 2,3-dioxygenase-like lactoylglutathione lyase family enzyme